MQTVERNYRLGIISPAPAWRDGDGRYWCNHSNGRLWDAIRALVPRAKLCWPVLPNRAADMQHQVKFAGDDVVELPPLASVIRAQQHYFATRRIIRRFAQGVDVLFLRTPFQIPSLLRGLPKPKLLHVVGNPQQVISASTDYRGIMKFLALRFAAHSTATLKKIAAEPNARVATNGGEMWKLLGCRAGKVVVSSCIWRSEMQPRDDWRLHDPPRLLFVGYLRPEKGADVLLDAFEQLRAQRPLSLTIVGDSDRDSSGAVARLRERIDTSPYRADIRLTGMVEFGPPLFELYRSHDLFVLPSLSEGTPRTLVEARAFGCPAVASRAGGIPASVRDGEDGLLVPPGNAVELAGAMTRLLDDDALRQRFIRAGLERSDQSSLEHFAEKLIEEVDILVAERRAAAPARQPAAVGS